MSAELQLVEYYENQQKVVALWAAGNRINDIQRETGFSRKDIEKYLAEFREWASQDRVLSERSREVVLVVDTHYSNIIKDMHDAVKQADLNEDYKARITGLKAIADVEAKRVELIQKAGLLTDNALGDQIVEQERKQKILIDILSSKVCPDCKRTVLAELQKITTVVEPL